MRQYYSVDKKQKPVVKLKNKEGSSRMSDSGTVTLNFKELSMARVKSFLCLAACLVLIGGSAFAGGSFGQKASSSEKRLVLYCEREFRSLNQLTASDTNVFEILGNANESLYRIGANGDLTPGLATSHEVSHDGLVYTFHLRSGLKWSNGDPLTAVDFVYSWTKLVANPENSYGNMVYDYVVNALDFQQGKATKDQVGVKATDPLTLQVTLKTPIAYFAQLTTMPMFCPLQEKFVEAKGDNFALTANDMLYSGPFMITEFDLATGVTMVKNPNYWDAANVKLDAVEMRVIKEQGAALNAYQAGEIHRVNLTAQDIPSFKNDPELSTFSDYRNNYLQFNTKNPEMNVNIRKALSFAVDRELLCSRILTDGSVPAGGVVSQGVAGDGKKTFRQLNGNVSAYDAGKAKEFWNKGVAELGRVPQLTMLCMDDSNTKNLATFVQDQFRRNLGIEVTISAMTQRARNDVMETNEKYNLAISAWGADYDDAMTYLNLWISYRGYRGSYDSPEYVKMITDAKAEPNAAKRLDIMLRAEKKLVEEDMVVTGLYDRGFTSLTKKNVKGLVYHAVGQPLDLKWASIE
jgi:oligopeptide transport system substrate-binding protein